MHGVPVKSVYGFGFCGNSCENQKNTYSVGFLKLTAPAFLGQPFCAEECWQDFQSSDGLGVKLLYLYMKSVKLWDMDATTLESRVDQDSRNPCLFSAPQKY